MMSQMSQTIIVVNQQINTLLSAKLIRKIFKLLIIKMEKAGFEARSFALTLGGLLVLHKHTDNDARGW